MPAPLVVSTAMMSCSFGAAPASLIVLPNPQVLVEGKPIAVINDFQGTKNIPTFGMCSSLSNPQVASATSAAQGVLTPQPCLPKPTAWKVGVPLVQVGGAAVVNAPCTSTCAWGGQITITNPGSTQTVG